MAKVTRKHKPKTRRRVTIALENSTYQTGVRLAKREQRSFSNWLGVQIDREWKSLNPQ